jgi:aminopeptidase-like protein
MEQLIDDLYLTNRALVSDDYDSALAYIDDRELDLTVRTYPSGMEIWDSWIVPQKWTVEHAYIETADGERILSYDDHPLHLFAYSGSYEGWVDRDELRSRIRTHPQMPDAIPYHFRLSYRPWETDWGFCASQNFVDSLSDDKYYVSISTTLEDGEMKVGEYHLEGEREETILLLAHLDHIGLANDDLSGVAVGIELMQRLRERTDRTYSYRLLLLPEIIGSAAYLDDEAVDASRFEYGLFLETLGNDNRLMLQHTFTEETKLDRIAKQILTTDYDEFEINGFRDEAGDDELIFEGPGYEIPTVSISRYPYEEYHTHFDDMSIIHQEQLEDSVEYILNVLDVFERDFTPVRTFDGVPSLANPKYDLYIDPGQPGISESPMASENVRDFRDRVFRYLDGDHTVFDIADRFDLEFEFVHDYLSEFHDKGLVTKAER